MASHSHQIILWRTAQSLLTLQDLASAAGVHPEIVEKFVSYGLIEPITPDGAYALFSALSVKRLKCILRLRHDLGVNLPGVAVILEMKERLEALQHELEHYRHNGLG